MKLIRILGLCAGVALFSATPAIAFANSLPSEFISRKVISINNQTLSRPYGLVHDGTTYMPIWYLMNALKDIGITSNWDGQSWHLTVSSSQVNMNNVNPGTGGMDIYLNGRLVQKVDGISATDPAAAQETTYMPSWYLMQILDRMNVNSNWNGTTWNLSFAGKFSPIHTSSVNKSYAETTTSTSDARSRSYSSSNTAGTSISRQDIVDYSKQFIGTPYEYGGESSSGFDCSGFVQAVYRHFDISLPRTAADQAQVGDVVSKSDLEPGDLVFFNTTGDDFSHVGIYIGNSEFISATTSHGVRICKLNDPYYWGSRFSRATNPLA